MPTITGTLANDTLYGTEDHYLDIYGLDGNDRIIAGLMGGSYAGQKDNYYGGSGDDTYVVNLNAKSMRIWEDETAVNDTDIIEFGAGITLADLYFYSFGSLTISIPSSAIYDTSIEILFQTDGNKIEELHFADGSVYEIENIGNNIVHLNADDNDNVITAMGSHAVYLDAGGGDDIIYGSDIPQEFGLTTRSFDDTIFGGSGNDIIYGGKGTDTLYGGEGNDIIYAGLDGGNYIYGDDGDDWIYGSDGRNDTIRGGDGFDTIYIGNNAINSIYGDAGSDEIHMGFNYGPVTSDSRTVLRGGDDNDVYVFDWDDVDGYISHPVKIIDDSGSYDTIVLNGDFQYSTTNVYGGGLGIDDNRLPRVYYMIDTNSPDLNDEIERITFSDKSIYTVDYDLSVGFFLSQITATSGNDTLYLTAWHDDFHAGDGDDTIYALERDDIVDGGAGDDTLYGEHGNDTLIGGAGNDVLNGGIGIDTADYTNAAAGVDVTLSGDTTTDDGDGGVDTLYSIENINGSQFADDIRLDNLNNVANGNAGNDILYGYNGNDVLNGGDGADYINAGNDDDIVDGGAGNDDIYASYGNDNLYGGAGVDKLYGGAGDNVLNGGDGIDYLYSGSGADRFVFENIDDSQGGSVYDRVYSFDDTEGDVIDISDLVSNYDAGIDDINDFVVFLEYGNDMFVRVDGDGTGTSYSETNVARLYNYNGWDGLSVNDVITSGQLIIA